MTDRGSDRLRFSLLDFKLGVRMLVRYPGLTIVGALAMAFRHWRESAGTRGARLRYSAVVVCGIVFLWSLNMWNLLGWRM